MATVSVEGPDGRPLRRVLDESGVLVDGAALPTGLSTGDQLKLLRLMLRQRLLDDLMLTLQRQGRIGFYGPCTGQEAAVFGSGWALEERDWILPALREGGVALMRGYPLEDYIAQCFGNALDRSKGRQMPCHYGAIEQHYATLSSPIGNQLPQAVGVAMAMQARGTDAVCIGYMGDGATSENDFHSALDMARRTKTPVVFFCQNNQWAISVPVAGQTAAPTLAARAAAFRVPAERVDGNDVFAVIEVTREAVARARAGEGPTFVEALTYRIGAHSTSDDPSRYRDESVTDQWRLRDPIGRLRAWLVAGGLITSAAAEALEVELAATIRDTLARVEAADPSPPLATLFDDVFAERTWLLEEQAAAAARFGLPTGH